jgi:hypothetical protein
MNPGLFSEDALIEKPAIQLLAELANGLLHFREARKQRRVSFFGIE